MKPGRLSPRPFTFDEMDEAGLEPLDFNEPDYRQLLDDRPYSPDDEDEDE